MDSERKERIFLMASNLILNYFLEVILFSWNLAAIVIWILLYVQDDH